MRDEYKKFVSRQKAPEELIQKTLHTIDAHEKPKSKSGIAFARVAVLAAACVAAIAIGVYVWDGNGSSDIPFATIAAQPDSGMIGGGYNFGVLDMMKADWTPGQLAEHIGTDLSALPDGYELEAWDISASLNSDMSVKSVDAILTYYKGNDKVILNYSENKSADGYKTGNPYLVSGVLVYFSEDDSGGFYACFEKNENDVLISSSGLPKDSFVSGIKSILKQ